MNYQQTIADIVMVIFMLDGDISENKRYFDCFDYLLIACYRTMTSCVMRKVVVNILHLQIIVAKYANRVIFILYYAIFIQLCAPIQGGCRICT